MNEENSPLNEKSKVTLQTKTQAETVLDVTSLPKNNDHAPVDTSVIDDQWAEMSQDWQSQPFTKVDIPKLLKQTTRRTLWAKGLLALDIIATIGMLFVAAYLWLSGSQDQATIIYSGVGGALSVIFVYYTIKVRLTAWRANCGSPDKAIEHAMGSCESSIGYIKLIKLSCIIILPFANWYIFAISQQLGKSPVIGLVMINALILIVWLFSHIFYLKRNKELKQLNSMNSK
jgi:hypothetical protein